MKTKSKLLRMGILIMTGMILSVAAVNAFEIESKAVAIEKAGKTRMFPTRIFKDYLILGMDLKYGNLAQEMEATVAEFDATLDALEKYIKDPAIKAKLDAEEALWLKEKHMIKQPFDKSQTMHYTQIIMGIAQRGDDSVKMLAGGKDNSLAVIGLAARMRSLSQTIAAAYMLKTMGANGSKKILQRAMKKFRGSLDAVNKSSGTIPEGKTLAGHLEKTYLFLQVMNDALDAFTPSLLIKKTNQMLKDADALTQTYLTQG